ncbi:hypothetical protein L9F63_027604 [Diploptera punctata]|uniref:Uncharacterized protein n=1 Tax=Diploptera punctata TaxID=6984 RepID=A0AAD8A886_DIPPU|nr:hypothetical protein L9F63_027604 [Diploptera punctata]
MKVTTLLRESREVHANATLKQKKTAVRKQAAQHHVPMVAASNVSIQPITAFSTASSTIKSKSAAISVTPVSSVSSSISGAISHIPSTLKMKPETSVMFPHGVSTSNSSSSTNSNRLPIQQLAVPPPVSNRKKTVGDVTIAKVVNSSGKSSPSFQTEKQGSVLSVKSKMNVDRVSPKTLDLSTSSVNRSVLINNVPGSPSKSKGSSEINSVPETVQKNILMNIPDCISVTPSLPSPNPSSIVTTVSVPITTSMPKSMMSLKQRILHDTCMDQSGGAVKMNPSLGIRSEDDGIEVIEILKDTKKSENNMTVKQVTRNENVVQPKNEPRKRKKVENVTSTNSLISDKSSSMAMTAASGPANTVITTIYSSNSCITSASTYSSPANALSSTASMPTHSLEKDVERLLKDEEEAAAAADFLSQINESLKNLNSTSGIETAHSDSPKINSLPSPMSFSPSTEQKQKIAVSIEEENVNLKVNDVKRKAEPSSTSQYDEESVQLEVDRVMKELQELQQLSAEKNRESDFSPVKTVIIPKVVAGSTNCVTMTTSSKSHSNKINKLQSDNSMVMSVLGRRPSTGSTSDLAKMSYGFQDEFQKHLFQDSLIKQSDTDVQNSCKIPRNKSPGVYPQINQPIPNTASSRPSQNSPLEGCVAGSQQRSWSDTNSTINYTKFMRTSSPLLTYLSQVPVSIPLHIDQYKNSKHQIVVRRLQ